MMIKKGNYIEITDESEAFNPFKKKIFYLSDVVVLEGEDAKSFNSVLGENYGKRYIFRDYDDGAIAVVNEGAFIKLSDKNVKQLKIEFKTRELYKRFNISRIKDGTKIKLNAEQAYDLCKQSKSFVPDILTVKKIRFIGKGAGQYDFGYDRYGLSKFSTNCVPMYIISFYETESNLSTYRNGQLDYIEIIEDSNDETVR